MVMNIHKAQRPLLFFAVALVAMNCDVSYGDKLVVDVSYQFETGDYSEQSDTDVTSIPVQLKYYADVWSFSVKVPFLSVTGVETIIPGSNGQSFGHGGMNSATGSSSSSTVTRSGPGDIRVSVSRAFLSQQPGDLFYEMTATVKLATADEKKFLGTGENDYSIKIFISSTIGNWMPGLTLGYLVTGDTADIDYNDVFFISAGTAYLLSRKSTLGIEYDYQQAVSEGDDDFAAITADYSYEFSKGSSVGFAIKKGLTDNSPDIGFNISTSISF